MSPSMFPAHMQDPDVRLLGIAEAAYACVMMQTEPVLRKIQFENMFVCGGSSSLPGLAQRFSKDVKLLVSPSITPALILYASPSLIVCSKSNYCFLEYFDPINISFL